MHITTFILHIIEYLLYAYFAFAAVYVLIFAIGSVMSPKSNPLTANHLRKIAVLIPGYKEDSVIVDVAKEALNQNYPKEKYDVVIIADSFQPETITKLKELPIKLIEVSFDKSTKSKALNKAMAELPVDYEIALILDADNVMATDFVSKINDAFEAGFQIVQGHRVAKNTNTALAILDAVSEELNNSIFRKGHRALGLSSALIGSGMAFDYQLFKKRMTEIHAIGGFDKELELTFLRDGYIIEYLNDALVYDEKVQKVEVFENQRKRWLSAQFIYFERFFFSGVKHLIVNANIDFFDKVYQMVSPPRVLLIGLTTIITAIYTAFQLIFPEITACAISYTLWLSVWGSVVVAFILSIPKQFYNTQTLRALLTLPKAFFSMFISLFRLKGANKKFIHTQHGTT
jgi:cellulose synthase/poly-beta-1,6-N-acetylglucosamine synthase-like glycosyltransferase